MKYIVVMILSLFVVSFGGYAVQPDLMNQMLDAQIERLEQELNEKQKRLGECQDTVNKLKIAGGVTVATTVAGVAANIALAEKKKNMVGPSGGGMPTDGRSQEQKNCDSCAMFIQAGIPLPDECAGCA